MGSLERLTREYSSGRRVMDRNLAEGFGDQAAQLLGAVEHLSERIRRCVSEGRIPLGPPCRRHGRQWAAWAPKIPQASLAAPLYASCLASAPSSRRRSCIRRSKLAKSSDCAPSDRDRKSTRLNSSH